MKSTSRITKTATTQRSFQGRFILVILSLVLCTLLPEAYAVNPPPDGGYSGFNTAEGQNALLSLDTSTGFANTAVGSLSLQTSVDASFNTAVGAGTLSLNTGSENTAVGAAALLLNTTGAANTAVGVDALLNNTLGAGNTADGALALSSNTEGNNNTASGVSALQNDLLGSENTATGAFALLANTSGNDNTATGFAALQNNTASSNTASGALALFSNTEGSDNTATGSSALKDNTTGEANTANGVGALESNTQGDLNTATGEVALSFNITGSGNTANGVAALLNNIDGNSNTANGLSALHDNTSGSFNTADGDHALFENVEGTGNTAVGAGALSSVTSGSSNTALGENAGHNLFKSDSNNIDIGFDVQGVAGESNTIRIGNPDITTTIVRGISGQTIPSGAAVLVAANGQLGTVTSSARFKEDIQAMDKASEVLFSLKPVTFHYKKEIDPAATRQFGLVAEEVEKLNPDLVVRDERGQVNSVRYDQVNAMLLNEFLKEHKAFLEERERVEAQDRRMREQDAVIAELEANMMQHCRAIQAVMALVKEQAAQIQTVNAEVELNRTGHQQITMVIP